MIKIGCSGFPVSRPRYFQRYATVEIADTFEALPRPQTLKRWREEAPEGFEYAVWAWRPITHPGSGPAARDGHFRDTAEVARAWERFSEVVEALRPRFVVFPTPPSFHNSADHLRDLYRFFKSLRRRDFTPVWEPRGGGWGEDLVRKVCADLRLLQGGVEGSGSVVYCRTGGRQGPPEDAELADLVRRIDGRPAYVYCRGVSGWKDAERLSALTEPHQPWLRTRPAGRRY